MDESATEPQKNDVDDSMRADSLREAMRNLEDVSERLSAAADALQHVAILLAAPNIIAVAGHATVAQIGAQQALLECRVELNTIEAWL